MDKVLLETLRLVKKQYGDRRLGSVFILIQEFPWHNEPNGQLRILQQEGYISNLRFFDDGAEITLSSKSWDLFEKMDMKFDFSYDSYYRMLKCIQAVMEVPKDSDGKRLENADRLIATLQNEGYIVGAKIKNLPREYLVVTMDQTLISEKGLRLVI